MKFDVIVVDPPWEQGRTGKRSSRPNQTHESDYPTMSIEDICDIPIEGISKTDSVCFLWATQKFLRYAPSIIESWGFVPRWTITWDKGNGMTLQGFHLRTEFVVFGSRGSLPTFMEGKAMPTLIAEHTFRQHSVKPSKFYEYASDFGLMRIDIFARQEREDWYCVGYELTGNDILEDIRIAKEI